MPKASMLIDSEFDNKGTEKAKKEIQETQEVIDGGLKKGTTLADQMLDALSKLDVKDELKTQLDVTADASGELKQSFDDTFRSVQKLRKETKQAADDGIFGALALKGKVYDYTNALQGATFQVGILRSQMENFGKQGKMPTESFAVLESHLANTDELLNTATKDLTKLQSLAEATPKSLGLQDQIEALLNRIVELRGEVSEFKGTASSLEPLTKSVEELAQENYKATVAAQKNKSALEDIGHAKFVQPEEIRSSMAAVGDAINEVMPEVAELQQELSTTLGKLDVLGLQGDESARKLAVGLEPPTSKLTQILALLTTIQERFVRLAGKGDVTPKGIENFNNELAELKGLLGEVDDLYNAFNETTSDVKGTEEVRELTDGLSKTSNLTGGLREGIDGLGAALENLKPGGFQAIKDASEQMYVSTSKTVGVVDELADTLDTTDAAKLEQQLKAVGDVLSMAASPAYEMSEALESARIEANRMAEAGDEGGEKLAEGIAEAKGEYLDILKVIEALVFKHKQLMAAGEMTPEGVEEWWQQVNKLIDRADAAQRKIDELYDTASDTPGTGKLLNELDRTGDHAENLEDTLMDLGGTVEEIEAGRFREIATDAGEATTIIEGMREALQELDAGEVIDIDTKKVKDARSEAVAALDEINAEGEQVSNTLGNIANIRVKGLSEGTADLKEMLGVSDQVEAAVKDVGKAAADTQPPFRGLVDSAAMMDEALKPIEKQFKELAIDADVLEKKNVMGAEAYINKQKEIVAHISNTRAHLKRWLELSKKIESGEYGARDIEELNKYAQLALSSFGHLRNAMEDVNDQAAELGRKKPLMPMAADQEKYHSNWLKIQKETDHQLLKTAQLTDETEKLYDVVKRVAETDVAEILPEKKRVPLSEGVPGLGPVMGEAAETETAFKSLGVTKDKLMDNFRKLAATLSESMGGFENLIPSIQELSGKLSGLAGALAGIEPGAAQADAGLERVEGSLQAVRGLIMTLVGPIRSAKEDFKMFSESIKAGDNDRQFVDLSRALNSVSGMAGEAGRALTNAQNRMREFAAAGEDLTPEQLKEFQALFSIMNKDLGTTKGELEKVLTVLDKFESEAEGDPALKRQFQDIREVVQSYIKEIELAEGRTEQFVKKQHTPAGEGRTGSAGAGAQNIGVSQQEITGIQKALSDLNKTLILVQDVIKNIGQQAPRAFNNVEQAAERASRSTSNAREEARQLQEFYKNQLAEDGVRGIDNIIKKLDEYKAEAKEAKHASDAMFPEVEEARKSEKAIEDLKKSLLDGVESQKLWKEESKATDILSRILHADFNRLGFAIFVTTSTFRNFNQILRTVKQQLDAAIKALKITDALGRVARETGRSISDLRDSLTEAAQGYMTLEEVTKTSVNLLQQGGDAAVDFADDIVSAARKIEILTAGQIDATEAAQALTDAITEGSTSALDGLPYFEDLADKIDASKRIAELYPDAFDEYPNIVPIINDVRDAIVEFNLVNKGLYESGEQAAAVGGFIDQFFSAFSGAAGGLFGLTQDAEGNIDGATEAGAAFADAMIPIPVVLGLIVKSLIEGEEPLEGWIELMEQGARGAGVAVPYMREFEDSASELNETLSLTTRESDALNRVLEDRSLYSPDLKITREELEAIVEVLKEYQDINWPKPDDELMSDMEIQMLSQWAGQLVEVRKKALEGAEQEPFTLGGYDVTSALAELDEIDSDETKFREDSAAAWTKYQETLADIQEKQYDIDSQKYLDEWKEAQEDFNDDMIDLANELAEEIDKINDDLAIKESRTIEDFNDKRAKQNKKHNDKLIDIEEDYQKKLRDIQRKYDLSRLSAIIDRDARALFEAEMRRREELAKAAEDAREKREEEQKNHADSMADIDAQEEKKLARMREDAQRKRDAANEEYEKDKIALEEALEEQRQTIKDNWAQEVEDRREAAEEAREDALEAYNDEVDDLIKNFQKRRLIIKRDLLKEQLLYMQSVEGTDEIQQDRFNTWLDDMEQYRYSAQIEVNEINAILEEIGDGLADTIILPTIIDPNDYNTGNGGGGGGGGGGDDDPNPPPDDEPEEVELECEYRIQNWTPSIRVGGDCNYYAQRNYADKVACVPNSSGGYSKWMCSHNGTAYVWFLLEGNPGSQGSVTATSPSPSLSTTSNSSVGPDGQVTFAGINPIGAVALAGGGTGTVTEIPVTLRTSDTTLAAILDEIVYEAFIEITSEGEIR